MGLFRKKRKNIWEIKKADEFVIAMNEFVFKKCNYGEIIDILNAGERIFYITQICEQEVNNGGFSQFFYNSSGRFSNEIVQAFISIGAVKTAKICEKALSALGEALPTDDAQRQSVLEAKLNNHKTEAVLEACDEAFYEYNDDLTALNQAYIMKHKESFNYQG